MKQYVHNKNPNIPMSSTTNLRTELPNVMNESFLPDTGTYRYLCDRTRYDILVAVGEVSTGGTPHPSDMHIKTSKQIFNYLKSIADLKLKLGGRGCNQFLSQIVAQYNV